MSSGIVHILRFPLICDLPACHIGALKMKQSSHRHSTISDFEKYMVGKIL